MAAVGPPNQGCGQALAISLAHAARVHPVGHVVDVVCNQLIKHVSKATVNADVSQATCILRTWQSATPITLSPILLIGIESERPDQTLSRLGIIPHRLPYSTANVGLCRQQYSFHIHRDRIVACDDW